VVEDYSMANVVFFAFASVPDQKEKIESGPSILVADLKYRISEKKFLPIHDISLIDEGTKETLSDDTYVSANSSVLVKRVAAKRRKPRTVVQASKKQKVRLHWKSQPHDFKILTNVFDTFSLSNSFNSINIQFSKFDFVR
jgi:hypothetical protein